MSDVGLQVMLASTSILFVHLLKLCDFGAEVPNFFAKDFEVFHTSRIAHLDRFVRRALILRVLCPVVLDQNRVAL